MEIISRTATFGGEIRRLKHRSEACACDMVFGVFLPPQARQGPVPALLWLSGLTCTDENFMIKAGAQRIAAELGIALVCERHVGVGLTASDIRSQRLPLPLRDMVPVSIEEILICYADKFFSKSGQGRELPLKAIVDELNRFGQDKARLFLAWHERFKRCQQ